MSATAAGGAAGVTQEQIVAALTTMSPAQRAELSAALAPPASTPATPKMSGPIDQVPDGDVGRVLAACREGIKLVTDEPATSADKVLAPLLGVSPRLAAAAQANATHRRKDVAHSLRVIVERLSARAPKPAAR